MKPKSAMFSLLANPVPGVPTECMRVAFALTWRREENVSMCCRMWLCAWGFLGCCIRSARGRLHGNGSYCHVARLTPERSQSSFRGLGAEFKTMRRTGCDRRRYLRVAYP